jgi:PAS domain S-box-containing protein
MISAAGILHFQKSADQVALSYDALASLQNIPDDLKKIEAGSRGYILAKDRSFLNDFDAGKKLIDNDLKQAQYLMKGAPVFEESFGRLKYLITEKIFFSDKLVEYTEKGNIESATRLMQSGRSQKLMEQVREKITEMKNEELDLLHKRKAAEQKSGVSLLKILLTGSTLGVVFCILAAFYFIRQFRERQRTNQHLAASERRYRSLTESANDSFITTDQNGIIVSVNPVTELIFGYPEEEMVGQPISIIFSNRFVEEADEKPIERLFEMTHSENSINTVEVSVKRKDGNEFPAEVSVASWSNREGEFYTAISRDISERKFITKMLQKNERRLFQFLEAVPIGIFVLDRSGKPYYANRTAKHLLEKPVDNQIAPEKLAEFYQLFLADTDQPYPAERMPPLKALSGEKSSVDDMEIRKSNRAIPLQVWGVPILDEAGGVKFSVAALLDITDRVESLKALREREEFFRNLFEESPIGMTLSFPDTTIVNANRALCQMFGYSQDELIGSSFLNLTHPDYIAMEKSLNDQLMGNAIPKYQLEKRYITRDKREIWGKITASAIRSVDGEPLFRLAIVENINERKQAETALRESEEKFRVLYESSRDAIMTLSPPEWRFTSGNNATVAMFRAKDEAEFTSKGPWELSPERQPDGRLSAEKAKEMIGKAMQEGSHFFEWTHKRLNGENFPATILLTRLEWKGQAILQATVRDITEQKQIDDMKRDVISIVSHQLKTPVAEINGYIENLLDGIAGVLTQKQREYLTDMKEIGSDNYRLLSDLLSMSKIERGIMTVDLHPVKLGQIVELAVRGYETQIQRKGLDLRLELDSSGIMVLADRDKTAEAVRNILNNAVKCTDKGSITIRTGEEGGFATLEVIDTGIGMSQDVMKRLFAKERVMGAEAMRSGANLGLYIAKNFLQLQKGDISVESEVGKGSTFRIKIPKE